MPFKEMPKPSPISRHTVITNNFSHTLFWRLDTCIQTLWTHNFNLLVESLGSHARILTYLFRINVLLNAEYLNKFFSESEPVKPVFDHNFTSASLWISEWFYRTSQLFLLFVKGMKIFTHSLGKILPHTRAQFGRKKVLQFLAKDLWDSKPALLLGSSGLLQLSLTYSVTQPNTGSAKGLGFSVSLLGCLAQREKRQPASASTELPVLREYFVMYSWPDCSPFTCPSNICRDEITKVSSRCCCDPHLVVLTHHPSLWASPVYFGQETAPGSAGPRHLIFCSV